MNRVGQTIDGRYLVERRLGTGGMAEVYGCEDLQLGRHVALKVLHEQLAEDPDVVARFRRESQSAAGLQHPHIVQVFDRGDWDGIPYMAMELVDGVTLKDVIRDQAPLDPVKTIDQISQVLDALRYAHKRGLVHRDIKPQNVLVGPDGDLKVADFGIARAVDDLQMTQTGMIVGTAHYLSPEQASGQPITTSADLYSVGVVLFEMLTGRMPFDGDQPVAIALKHVNEDPPALSIVNPEVPGDLEYVVLRSMSKQPEDRFEDAEEFIAALQGVRHRIVSGAPVPAQPQLAAAAAIAQQPTGGWLQPAAGMAVPAGVSPEDARENAEARRRRRWTIAIVGGLAALVVLALVGYLAFGRMETVPDVRNDTYEAARQKLEGQGFDVTRDQDRASSTVDRGEVIEQSPGDGRKVRRGTEVRLVVSSGPRSATVPSVEGLSLSDARQKLREAGFTEFQDSRIASETIAVDRVIGTAPAANTTARTGDRIVIQVSQGPTTGTTTTTTAPEQVTVPNLDGMTRSRAEAALKAVGLTATFTEQESDEDEGTVIAQQPGSRSEVDKGSNVAVTLATPNADSGGGGGETSTDVTVPNLEGRTQAAATAALRRLGLRPQVRTQTTTTQSENGDVIDQQPNGGRVARGSTVTVTIGVFEAAPDPDPDNEGSTPGDGTTGAAGAGSTSTASRDQGVRAGAGT
ncbi:Stk1 family PASTA domain-containing Ser/Thr kinase [Patulibacter sp.]|uniref:Stk1 family PASTA domain-containing Ser/Thr kinase n=1 Tax=Patulibacter sp. TaxID=1912859 RepID=UPI0027270414|nr:Stk1 family PASTA domain-containing Ser/Thr kinase [Patulibacter sp.]MDO9408898.1 Stk1 family PASTA domain-containing Ser/Thr kinase [Patulibacter sp.]